MSSKKARTKRRAHRLAQVKRPRPGGGSILPQNAPARPQEAPGAALRASLSQVATEACAGIPWQWLGQLWLKVPTLG